ncbi:hypothetical protein H5410_001267 [Solanum commersonii]|uniref:Uncharacterized protein n=1 Tax=Solanum commersonii TaxID=4109 RepID=A0A9J6AYF6_SOLCO|nr:hypothetical protein H5410_001267 [Solanum commersonii]
MDAYTGNIGHQKAVGNSGVLEVSDNRELALCPKPREIAATNCECFRTYRDIKGEFIKTPKVGSRDFSISKFIKFLSVQENLVTHLKRISDLTGNHVNI